MDCSAGGTCLAADVENNQSMIICHFIGRPKSARFAEKKKFIGFAQPVTYACIFNKNEVHLAIIYESFVK